MTLFTQKFILVCTSLYVSGVRCVVPLPPMYILLYRSWLLSVGAYDTTKQAPNTEQALNIKI